MLSEVKFNIFLRLLTNENIITPQLSKTVGVLFLCLKFQGSGLKIVPPFNSYFKGLHVGQFLTKSSKIPYYCLLPSLFGHFEGEGLISILKTWV